jgi:hypothetical protein
MPPVRVVPWVRGEQATIIDMDVLADLWAGLFGLGCATPVVIGSQDERT